MIYSVICFFFTMWIVLGNINIISGKHMTIYRYLWNAREEARVLPRFRLPIKYFYTSTCQTKACNTIQSCSSIVYEMQGEHMTKNGWDDIKYNFLVDGLGNVYEGTGWYTRAIQNEEEFLSICLFGIENYKTPPKEFSDGLQNILQFGKEIGYLSQVVKPLLNLKNMNNISNELWQQQKNWEYTVLQNINGSSPNEHKSQDNNTKNTAISGVDWSKVFPSRGNRTTLDSVILHKQTIEKSNWNKMFKTQDEVTSIDWSNLLREPMNQINWSEIFNDDNFDESNSNMFPSTGRSRTNTLVAKRT